jgi:uncharacterized membrane protein HdeD (DUF308 family)
VLLLWHPIKGVVTLTVALVAFFIVEGVVQTVGAFAWWSCPYHLIVRLRTIQPAAATTTTEPTRIARMSNCASSLAA